VHRSNSFFLVKRNSRIEFELDFAQSLSALAASLCNNNNNKYNKCIQQQQQKAETNGATAGLAERGGTNTTRLPQRQIRHFKGDVLEWTTFWENFNAAIRTPNITSIDKFDYLKEYLKGEARLFVDNLSHRCQL
jgi:hypothetical protein